MRKFLLTGATGVVGLSLIELLNDKDDITILVNSRHFSLLPSGVGTQIKGDITQDSFGLSDKQINILKSKVDCIVHSAALTDFIAEPNKLAAHNLEGLRNAIALAKRLDKKLFYVSTAFVKNRDGYDLNNYEQSKKEAESLLCEDVTVIRPSIIIGHSDDGSMPKKQGMHSMMKLTVKELLPVVPGKPNSVIDVIPRNIVAKAMMAIVDHKLSGEFWLTAGSQASTLGEFLKLGTQKEFREKYNLTFKPPKLISPVTFDRLIKPVFLPALPKKYKRMFNEASIYLKYLNMTDQFPSSLSQIEEETGIDLSFSVNHVMAKNVTSYNYSSAIEAHLENINESL